MYPNYCCSQPNCCSCCTPQNYCSTSQSGCMPSQSCCCNIDPCCNVDRSCCTPRRRLAPLAGTLVGVISSTASKRKLPAKNGKIGKNGKCIKNCKKEKCNKGEKKNEGESNEKPKKPKKPMDEVEDIIMADDVPVKATSRSSVSINLSQQAQLPSRRQSQNSCNPSLCSSRKFSDACLPENVRRSVSTDSPGTASPGSIRKTRNRHEDSISQGSYGESSRRASDQQQYVKSDESSISQKHGDSVKRSSKQPDDITNDESSTSIRSASQKQLKNKKNFENQDKSSRKPMEVIAEEEEPREVFADGGAKSIQDTCADFLNIVNDSVLDTVQKSVECMMQQYFCQTMERIDCLCAHMMRNDCLISKMYIDLMEKIRQQNEKSQLQFKCLCEFLIDSQKESAPNPCAGCFENIHLDFSKSPNYLGMESMTPAPWPTTTERMERPERNMGNMGCGCTSEQNCYKPPSLRRNSNDPSRQPSLTPNSKPGSISRNSNDPQEMITRSSLDPNADNPENSDKPGSIGRNSKDQSRLPSTSSNSDHRVNNDKPGSIGRSSKDNSLNSSSTEHREKAGYNRTHKADASCMTDNSYRQSVSKYSGPFISRYDLESFARGKIKPYQYENSIRQLRSSSKELPKPHSDLQLRYTHSRTIKPRNNRSDSSLSIT